MPREAGNQQLKTVVPDDETRFTNNRFVVGFKGEFGGRGG